MPQPLPRPNPYDANDEPNIAYFHTAYESCLDLERRHGQVKQCGTLQVLVCARFLGYMLLEAPINTGRKDFASEILRCMGDDDLQRLAEAYKDHFLRVFRSNNGSPPSRHPSAPSFDTQKHEIGSLFVAAPNKHNAKPRVLERDGYRCVFSGKLDIPSISVGLVPDDGGDLAVTHSAHIFDQSTNQGLQEENKAAYSATAFAVLARFGQIDAIVELNGDNMHRLENVLTLNSDSHTLFDTLKLWLERNPEDPVNHYTLASPEPFYRRGLLGQIILTTRDAKKLPLPDPRYLALHAACARVAHLSGAGEYIDMVLRDIEEIGVLANDGPSHALYHALVRRPDVQVEAY